MELLTKSNPCGWNILTIVSRGSSIIAEIQRLSQYIPEDFTFPKQQTNHQYARILYDYDYFGNEAVIENEIENNLLNEEEEQNNNGDNDSTIKENDEHESDKLSGIDFLENEIEKKEKELN